jgi:hypothetical protein
MGSTDAAPGGGVKRRLSDRDRLTLWCVACWVVVVVVVLAVMGFTTANMLIGVAFALGLGNVGSWLIWRRGARAGPFR